MLLPHFNDIEEQNNELDENILVLAACGISFANLLHIRYWTEDSFASLLALRPLYFLLDDSLAHVHSLVF